ncbi:hypothetical protein [Streptomyces fragilis]|nr:hypothetical protein [Streptomyces fragilis]
MTGGPVRWGWHATGPHRPTALPVRPGGGCATCLLYTSRCV